MEEKKVTKISLSTFFLILAIFAIIVMGIYIYKLNNDKTTEIQKSTELQAQVNSLNGIVSELQEKTTTISNPNSNDDTSNNSGTNDTSTNETKSLINKRLYKLANNQFQRYILLMDDNTYDSNQDFLKKKTYILDLNMTNSNDIVKEVDISKKLAPYVDEYINNKKGSLTGTFSVEYFEIDDNDLVEIDNENEIAFRVYYKCFDGKVETSLGTEIYAYNVKTDSIRDLGYVG